MNTLPNQPVHRVHMTDFKRQTLDEQDRRLEAWTRFAVGCLFVAVFAVTFVWMLVRAA